MDFITARHSGNSGDLVSSLPGLRELYRKTGKKIRLYLWLNRHAHYYEGAVHPVKNGEVQVMLNSYMQEALKPLIESQDYIESCQVWNGEHIDVNLDRIREVNLNMSAGTLSRWYFQVFPDMACDLSEPWLQVELLKTNRIIVNRTQRYLNPMMEYHLLRDYEDVWFAGTAAEHKIFCEEFGLDIPHLFVNDFYDLARAIAGCRFFIGNQSMCFQIAEGLKVPRIFESCYACQNVIPVGVHAYDVAMSSGLKYYVEYLNGLL